MSSRRKVSGSRPLPDGKPRRALQLLHQRQLRQKQLRQSAPYHRAGEDLPDKQQQTQHNPVSEGLPFGLFTSDQ